MPYVFVTLGGLLILVVDGYMAIRIYKGRKPHG